MLFTDIEISDGDKVKIGDTVKVTSYHGTVNCKLIEVDGHICIENHFLYGTMSCSMFLSISTIHKINANR